MKLYSLIFCFFTSIFSFSSQGYGQSEKIFQQLNYQLIDHYFLPHYEKFSKQANIFNHSVQSFCQNAQPEKVEKLHGPFHKLMNDWMAIQHIHFGPSQKYMRSLKINFWPDHKNRVSKSLKKLWQAKPETLLKNFENTSVAIQGLPALELVLMMPHYQKDLSQKNQFSCDYLQTLSHNVKKISHDMYREWQSDFQDKEKLEKKMKSGQHYFSTHNELSQVFFTSFAEGISAFHHFQLQIPLGETFEKSDIHKLQNTHSLRSLQNLQIAFHSLTKMFGYGYGDDQKLLFFAQLFNQNSLTKNDMAPIKNLFHEVNSSLQLLPSPLSSHLKSNKIWQQTKDIEEKVELIFKKITREIAPKANFIIGFNSLDGD